MAPHSPEKNPEHLPSHPLAERLATTALRQQCEQLKESADSPEGALAQTVWAYMELGMGEEEDAAADQAFLRAASIAETFLESADVSPEWYHTVKLARIFLPAFRARRNDSLGAPVLVGLRQELAAYLGGQGAAEESELYRLRTCLLLSVAALFDNPERLAFPLSPREARDEPRATAYVIHGGGRVLFSSLLTSEDRLKWLFGDQGFARSAHSALMLAPLVAKALRGGALNEQEQESISKAKEKFETVLNRENPIIYPPRPPYGEYRYAAPELQFPLALAEHVVLDPARRPASGFAATGGLWHDIEVGMSRGEPEVFLGAPQRIEDTTCVRDERVSLHLLRAFLPLFEQRARGVAPAVQDVVDLYPAIAAIIRSQKRTMSVDRGMLGEMLAFGALTWAAREDISLLLYPSSPRESQSVLGGVRYSHDGYLIANNEKVPVEVKFGEANRQHYHPAVRRLKMSTIISVVTGVSPQEKVAECRRIVGLLGEEPNGYPLEKRDRELLERIAARVKRQLFPEYTN